ncbi:MAG: ABC transporter ATP-binding protein [Nitratireductor sp.]
MNSKRDSSERRAAPRTGSLGETSPGTWGPRNTAGVAIASGMLFDRVSHSYGTNPVLDDVTIRVEPGEVLCLLGPSGSGKSTLLRMAAGLEQPASGRVWIDHRIVAGEGVFVPPEKRGVGLVFQDFALFPHLTILENVLFGLSGIESGIANEQARHMLSRVGVEALARSYPHQLSGGEQQRVALARALAPRPGILLMDEPFSGLDARLRDSVREGTIGLLRDTRSTAIVVTHDPEEALRVGDHIALMRDGRLVQYGAGEELYLKPASLFAARFFSELNVFNGKAFGGACDTAFGVVPGTRFEDGTRLACCIRHQDVRVLQWNAKSTGKRGRVARRRYIGIAELLEIFIEGSDEPVRARIPAGTLAAETRDVEVSVSPADVLVFLRD